MINEFGEFVEKLYDDKIIIERISSFSNVTDYMVENNDEFVYLLDGEAILEINGEKITLKKDNYYYIPKMTKHRVAYTSYDCKWLCIFINQGLK